MEEEWDEEATITRLKGVLKFDEATCRIIWTNPTSPRVSVGRPYGCEDDRGYIAGRVFGRKWYEHQLVFAFVHGYIPDEIDHIDRDKSNNNPNNLRDTTRNDNNRNRDVYNSVGVKGVYKSERGRYSAKLTHNKVNHHLGSFDTIEEAKQAVIAKRKELGITIS